MWLDALIRLISTRGSDGDARQKTIHRTARTGLDEVGHSSRADEDDRHPANPLLLLGIVLGAFA